MATIPIEHFLYGRVEGEYSRRRRSGFQTIYEPDGSDPNDIVALEKRVLCFQPDRPDRIRLQFFTHGAHIIVGHTCRVEPNPEIIDHNERTGAFIAHCLLVPRAAFAEIANNPFVLLDNYRFVTTPEGLRAFLQDAANRPVQLTVELPALPTATDWEGNEARRLWSLAMQASDLTQAGQSQQFVGSAAQIHEALRAVFSLVQPDQRLACSFDSCVDGCQVPSGTYWAIGSASSRSGSTLHIDAAARSVVGHMQEAQAEDNLYAAWLWSATDRQDFAAMLQYAPTIQRLAAAFRTRSTPPEEALQDITGCQEFFQHHRQSILAGVVQAIARYVKTPTLPSVLAKRYVVEETDLPELLTIAATQHIAPNALAEVAYDWAIEQETISDADAKQLADLGKRAGHLKLTFLGAIARRHPDAKLRDTVLARMDVSQYKRVLDTFGNDFPLDQFVAREHFDALFNYAINGRPLSHNEVVDLVQAIVAAEGTSKLGPLAPLLAGLPRGHLQKIQKFIGPNSETSVAFRHSLEEHLKQQPGFFDRLRKRL